MNHNIKNSVIFFLITIFLCASTIPFVCSSSFFWLFVDNMVLVRDEKLTLSGFTTKIEKGVTERIGYHDNLMDLNSIVMNLSGVEFVEKKDGFTVVKTPEDMLAFERAYVSDELLDEYANNVDAVYKKAKELGAGFLYIEAPAKGYNDDYSICVDNYEKSNYDRFAKLLEQKSIPYINVRKEMEQDGLSDLDVFFLTDHHWKPESGFWAFSKICEYLKEQYDFFYDESLTDLDNYNQEVYEDWFLGSQGKKVGRFFNASLLETNIDDITLITPKFPTDMTEEQPVKNQVRTGEFLQSMLYMEHLKEKDHYNKNAYAVYSGGDFRLQILRNHLDTSGKKILIVRDSYACVVTPFLALAASEVHVLDIRNAEYYVGERLNVSEYMEEIKPDCVLVLYTSVGINDARFDFR